MCARRARRSERGAMAVEFALVFPIVFAVMLGVIQYGVYFWGRSTAAASARESARQLAVGTDWTCSHDQAVANTNRAGKNVVVTRTYLNDDNAAKIGDLVQVTVTAKTLAPSLLPVPDSGAITEVATARVENIPSTPVAC
ncbi:pilus assembly protein [Nocardioides pocheonensis]|uniref:Pilus assembly protein n=2 Tax=Nocardioides pocheonensis TaxID=661485 RepID=A0A3N0GUK7_9ACTN|nr:pilus assembly protein [Nocardioides pocheonensis]